MGSEVLEGRDTVSHRAAVARAVRATKRTRQVASLVVFASGFMTLVSGLTPSIRSRVRALTWIPIGVHAAVFAVTVVAGLGLVLLSGAMRRGQRRAWRTAVVLLLVGAVAHLFKGLDVEEAVVSLLIAAWLIAARRRFAAPSAPWSNVWRSRVAAGLAVSSAVLISAAMVNVRRLHLDFARSLAAVSERLVGVQSIRIGGRLDRVLSPALLTTGCGLILTMVLLVLRPAGAASIGDAPVAQARSLVAAHGRGTLDYFALRADKRRWVFDRTLVAYGVFNGTCLVSPDPVGPADEAIDAWGAFAQFAVDQGWTLAVLGASEAWRDIYAEFGMRSIYIGDEAVVDLHDFALSGGQMKGLRQAVNRIAKYGYTISFHDPATLDPRLAASLTALMAESRRGAVERGFSMTLSRILDPADRGLLLAVCTAPDGKPAAFCQYVPAGPSGYSLDLMRRSTAEHPNGLTDFVIVRTIEHLRQTTACTTLSLNFATMRAVVAGEQTGVGSALQRNVLTRMSETMQIESLWKYTLKFHPRWQPRYLLYDSADHLGSIGLAVARAESFWELPVIGGLLEGRPGREPIRQGGAS